MIGGNDVVVCRGRDTIALRDFVWGFFKSRWPDALKVFEPAEPNTWFVYENRRAYEAWEEEGGTDVNLDTMVQVIFGYRGTTLVVSHLPGARTAGMALDLRDRLNANRTTGHVL